MLRDRFIPHRIHPHPPHESRWRSDLTYLFRGMYSQYGGLAMFWLDQRVEASEEARRCVYSLHVCLDISILGHLMWSGHLVVGGRWSVVSNFSPLFVVKSEK